jgi:citronellyl-CoA dehydrogenase
MKFTEEHTQIPDTVRRFVANEINPLPKSGRRQGSSPHTNCSRKWRSGPAGHRYPTEYGMGLLRYSMVAAEALGDCNGAVCPWPLACRPI